MNIIFCLDDNYVEHCAAAMASVISNNPAARITFHLFVDRLSARHREQLTAWIASLEQCELNIYDISVEDFGCFPIGEAYVNLTTYFRLVVHRYLKDIDKALYLDCDVLVNDSLADLWNTDISGYALAGVRDRMNDSIRLYNRLRYDSRYGYVNAGVLLINLKAWRESSLLERAKEVAERMPQALKNHDQDILNILFHDRMLMLPFRYNLMEYYLYTEDWLYLDRKYYPEIIEACQHPAIIHFCMPTKPWHAECVNPHRSLYLQYRAMTPWPQVTLMHRREHLSQKQRLKLLLEKLGLYHVERKSTLRRDISVIEEPTNVLF